MLNRDLLVEFLKSLDEDVKVAIYNEYCDSTNSMDDYIYSMDQMSELFNDVDDVLSRINFKEFDYSDAYFWFDGYGNIISSDYPTDESAFWDEVADDFIENGDRSRWSYSVLKDEIKNNLQEQLENIVD